MKARVYVNLKSGVLDPQGKAIEHALHSLGFESVNDVRQGKFIDLTIEAETEAEAEAEIKKMCEKLLANPVIETYAVTLNRNG